MTNRKYGHDRLIETGLCVGAAAVLATALYFLIWPAVDRAFFAKPEEPKLSDAALIDEAMKIPGAIVLSPHRDRRDFNIYAVTGADLDDSFSVKLCSPGIAVRTKKRWCVWVLGECMYKEGVPKDSAVFGNSVIVHNPGHEEVSMDGKYTEFFSSANGYPAAFNDFQQCITEGNAPDPIDPKKFDDRHLMSLSTCKDDGDYTDAHFVNRPDGGQGLSLTCGAKKP